MNIIVNTAATRTSGGLTIYKQFIEHLPEYIGGNHYYIFVDSSMPQPAIDGVEYIRDDNHSWAHRIYWDYIGCCRWLKKRRIVHDVIVSLQNSGVITQSRQIVYYHQPLPFYNRSWSFFNPFERVMALYKYIYPLIIKPTFSLKTDVVVQIPFIKKGFMKRFRLPEEKVHVLFPDIEDINIADIKPLALDEKCVHLVFPAVYTPYKEHSTIIEAVALLSERNPDLASRIRVHFTLSKEGAGCLPALIQSKKLEQNFVFDGILPHQTLLSLYKASDALVFPSTIETLGLPLIEAARFGLPIIVSDLDYAHEVLCGYPGAFFAKPKDVTAWSDSIASVCINKIKYNPMEEKPSSWPAFFQLIKDNIN